jgi:hypothetical protein
VARARGFDKLSPNGGWEGPLLCVRPAEGLSPNGMEMA